MFDKFRDWRDKKSAAREIRKELEYKKFRKEDWEYIMEHLLYAYERVKNKDNNQVATLRWKDYRIPVTVDYLKDILAYSESVCQLVIKDYDNDIEKLKAEYDTY